MQVFTPYLVVENINVTCAYVTPKHVVEFFAYSDMNACYCKIRSVDNKLLRQ